MYTNVCSLCITRESTFKMSQNILMELQLHTPQALTADPEEQGSTADMGNTTCRVGIDTGCTDVIMVLRQFLVKSHT
jgi:hypothetical protein